MQSGRHADRLPEKVCVLGVAPGVAFVIKKTPEGFHHFVKVGGRWRNIPGLDFHRYVPGGLEAEIRIFAYDAQRRYWDERRVCVRVWDPETN